MREIGERYRIDEWKRDEMKDRGKDGKLKKDRIHSEKNAAKKEE